MPPTATMPIERLGGPFAISAPPHIEIQCDAFQGTLATLVKCVANQRIDLSLVALLPICEAYLDYLAASDRADLDGAANALLAMAYLIERKASRLLPQPEVEEPEDPFLTYDGLGITAFTPVLDCLEGSIEERERVFFRTSKEDVDYEIPLDIGLVSVADLSRVLETLLSRAIPDPPPHLSRPRRSLADQMSLTLRCLSEQPKNLLEVIEGEITRMEAVWWFLAILELIRLHHASVKFSPNGEILFWRTQCDS